MNKGNLIVIVVVLVILAVVWQIMQPAGPATVASDKGIECESKTEFVDGVLEITLLAEPPTRFNFEMRGTYGYSSVRRNGDEIWVSAYDSGGGAIWERFSVSKLEDSDPIWRDFGDLSTPKEFENLLSKSFGYGEAISSETSCVYTGNIPDNEFELPTGATVK